LVSHQAFGWMIMEFCGLERGCVYLRIKLLDRQFFAKLMSHRMHTHDRSRWRTRGGELSFLKIIALANRNKCGIKTIWSSQDYTPLSSQAPYKKILIEQLRCQAR
jgi:hypothetical protein